MKNGKLQNTLKVQIRFALISVAVIATLSACTKSRTPDIADEDLKSRIFAISELQNKNFQITTGDAVASASVQTSSVVAEKPKSKIAKSTVPSRLQSLFSQTEVQAGVSETYPVRFTVNKKYVNVFKIVKDDSELTMIEKKLAQKEAGSLIVPLFRIPIKRYGILEKIKNENKEETSNLQLIETDFSNATHIEIPIRYDDIKAIGADTKNVDALNEVFIASKLDGKVTTLRDIRDQLNISIAPADDTKVLARVDSSQGGSGKLYLFLITKSSKITDDKLLQQLKAGDLGAIDHCSKDVLAQLAADEQKDCVTLLTHEIAIDFVTPSLSKEDGDGTLSTTIDLEKSEKAVAAGLIRVPKNSVATTTNILDLGSLNPYNTIRVADIKNKEFLLRRTFEDGASSIMVFGPGASGSLDIVTFELEEDRLVVRKATTINGDDKSGKIDREELMSIPVIYLGRDLSQGTVVGKMSKTTKDLAEYVVLNWNENRIDALNSPMSYYENGACFRSTTATSITDLDNRMVTGVLNFSITGSYEFVDGCMSQYNMKDYWYGSGVQSNFNLKERISFKLHNNELDNKPGMDLPFRAQNLMGFGVFTAGEITKDSFGTGGNTPETMKAHPVILDFSNGKQLVYTLGGLPESGWEREALISGTKEVVADWNKSLSVAFAGTELARTTPYILLQIDGVDVPKGRLGDLDRNYIWNFEKSMDSGLLGLSQAGPNPRSGRIEQNNVLMYGGNLLSEIGSSQQLARLKRQHRAMKQAALDAFDAEQKLASEAAKTGNTVGTAQTPDGADQLIRRLTSRGVFSRPLTPIFNVKKIKSASVSSIQTAIKNLPRSTETSTVRTKNAMAQLTETAYLKRIYDQAIAMDATRDALTMNSLTAAEVLKTYGQRMTPDQRRELSGRSRNLALMAEFNRNFQKGPNCAISMNAITSGGAEDVDLQPKEVLFKNWYKATLVHEMGHSLGLTHNFQGSIDKANFLFAGEKADAATARNYSSVMDYVPDEEIHYAGPGPYDVHALRAIYTGLVELNPAITKLVETKNGKSSLAVPTRETDATGKPVIKTITVYPGNYISLADVKSITLGNKSWWKLDAQALSLIPLKRYAYCTDVHVGGDPSCNRWDMGTNDFEIAQYYANEYRSLYPALNSLGNRIDIRSFDSYLARVYMEFFGLRPFMDETYYKLINGWPQQAVMPTVYGGVTGLSLFTEIIGTPNTEASYDDQSRFSVLPVNIPKVDDKGNEVKDANGETVIDHVEKVVVEAKPIKDVFVPGSSDQIDTRGMEIDKALAILMLTQRGVGLPRYESIGLKVSYADFESLFGTTPQQSMVLGSLSEILMDNPVGKVMTSIGIANLDSSLKPNTTDLVRYYAVLGSSVILDADATEDKYNFASLFRVGSSLRTKPKGRFIVTKLGQSETSDTSQKLWAFDNSDLGANILRATAQKRALIEKSNDLSQTMLLALKGEMENDAAAQKTAMDKLASQLTELNKDGVLINEDEATHGVTVEAHANAALEFMKQNLALVKQASGLIKGGQITKDQLPAVLASIGAGIETTTKSLSIIGVAEKALLAGFGEKTEEGAIFRMYLSDQHLEKTHGVVTANLIFMNKLLTVMYPELNRLQ